MCQQHSTIHLCQGNSQRWGPSPSSRHIPAGHQQGLQNTGTCFCPTFHCVPLALNSGSFERKWLVPQGAGRTSSCTSLCSAFLDWRHLSSQLQPLRLDPQRWKCGRDPYQQLFSCLPSCLGIHEKKVFASPSFQVKSLCLDSIYKVLRPFVLKRISYEIPNCISLVARLRAFPFFLGHLDFLSCELLIFIAQFLPIGLTLKKKSICRPSLYIRD